jgi:hypothetical protein
MITLRHKGRAFTAARDGALGVTITADGRTVGTWAWDGEGIVALDDYRNLMPDTDDSEDVLAELSALLRAAELPS